MSNTILILNNHLTLINEIPVDLTKIMLTHRDVVKENGRIPGPNQLLLKSVQVNGCCSLKKNQKKKDKLSYKRDASITNHSTSFDRENETRIECISHGVEINQPNKDSSNLDVNRNKSVFSCRDTRRLKRKLGSKIFGFRDEVNLELANGTIADLAKSVDDIQVTCAQEGENSESLEGIKRNVFSAPDGTEHVNYKPLFISTSRKNYSNTSSPNSSLASYSLLQADDNESQSSFEIIDSADIDDLSSGSEPEIKRTQTVGGPNFASICTDTDRANTGQYQSRMNTSCNFMTWASASNNRRRASSVTPSAQLANNSRKSPSTAGQAAGAATAAEADAATDTVRTCSEVDGLSLSSSACQAGRRATSSEDLIQSQNLLLVPNLAGPYRSACGNQLAVGSSFETVCANQTNYMAQSDTRVKRQCAQCSGESEQGLQPLDSPQFEQMSIYDHYASPMSDTLDKLEVDAHCDILSNAGDELIYSKLEEECQRLEVKAELLEAKVAELEKRRFAADVPRTLVDNIIHHRKELRDLNVQLYKRQLDSDESDRQSGEVAASELSSPPIGRSVHQASSSRLRPSALICAESQVESSQARQDCAAYIRADQLSSARHYEPPGVESGQAISASPRGKFGTELRPGQENTADILEAIPAVCHLQRQQYMEKLSSAAANNHSSYIADLQHHQVHQNQHQHHHQYHNQQQHLQQLSRIRVQRRSYHHLDRQQPARKQDIYENVTASMLTEYETDDSNSVSAANAIYMRLPQQQQQQQPRRRSSRHQKMFHNQQQQQQRHVTHRIDVMPLDSSETLATADINSDASLLSAAAKLKSPPVRPNHFKGDFKQTKLILSPDSSSTPSSAESPR